MSNPQFIKGRGAQFNPNNRFDAHISSNEEIFYDQDDPESIKTKCIITYPKGIINKIDSPDVPADYGINPYQGCEHGCVYCFARNTHEYWGYSAGLDFESVILVKQNAPELVHKKLKSKSWQGSPVMISGNTDCYQPIEKKYELTRKILQLFHDYRNPVSLITKNKLLLRDLDIIKPMADKRLIRVAVSLNTLNDDFRQKLEPRASSVKSRIELIEALAQNNIPVTVLMAPIIPALNDMEFPIFLKKMYEIGANDVHFMFVRLNGAIGEIFIDWVEKVFPDRADKILNHIAAVHGGQISDSRFGTRMRGEGTYAQSIRDQFKIYKQKYFAKRSVPNFDLTLFHKRRDPQMSLF